MAGVSVLDKLCTHNRASLLKSRAGKESSHDLVGDQARQSLEEQVSVADPFGKRCGKVQFKEKVRGSPYGGLKLTEVQRFLKRTKKTYEEKY